MPVLVGVASASSNFAGAASSGNRSGRRAEALDRYQAVRVHLADELGVDPGSDLQRVYADLLADRVPAVTCRGCPLRGRSIAAAP